jgi:hypothetical protein
LLKSETALIVQIESNFDSLLGAMGVAERTMVDDKAKPSFDELVDRLVSQVLRSAKERRGETGAAGQPRNDAPDEATPEAEKPRPEDQGSHSR